MNRFEKWSVTSTAVATAATGVAYFGVKFLMEPTEPWAVINHPAQPWLLKAHILVAPLLVFAVGMIATRHIWQHLRRKIQLGRKSGIVTALVFAPMTISGYLIQAVATPVWVDVVSWLHIIVSVLFIVGMGAHLAVVLRRKQPETRQIATVTRSIRSSRHRAPTAAGH